MSPRSRAARPRAARTLRRRALGIQRPGPERRWGRDAPREQLLRGKARGHGVPQHLSRATPPSPTDAPSRHTQEHPWALWCMSRCLPPPDTSVPTLSQQASAPPSRHAPCQSPRNLPAQSATRGTGVTSVDPHTNPPTCSPRAGAEAAAQESRLHVRTHAAGAPPGATAGHSQPHPLVTKPHAQSHRDATVRQPHVPEGTERSCRFGR